MSIQKQILRILLVEDPATDCNGVSTLQQVTDTNSHCLLDTSTCQMARSRLAEGHYDAALINFQLGRQRVVDLLGSAADDQGRPPTLVFVEHLTDELDALIRCAGADDVLVTSGLNAQTLRRAVLYAVERRQLQAALNASEARARELASEHREDHDLVTGLRRRVGADALLQALLDQARVRQERLVMMFINLDRFSLINDALGFAIGDAVLRQIAARLEDAAGDRGLALHHAGDGFLVAISDVPLDADLHQLGAAWCSTIAEPLVLGDTPFYLTASIGVAAYPESADSTLSLSRQAELAAHGAKEIGRDSAVVFSPEMLESMERRQLLASRLHGALLRNEFALHYQPQVNAQDGVLVGLEALIRWNSPEFGLLMPSQFIPIAEDSGLILQIGSWVLREACRQIRQWRDAGFNNFVVGVNVAAAQMQRDDLIYNLQQLIAEFGIDPAELNLELTESTLIDNTERARQQMRACKRLGLGLSLDDFGTGYSSLSYLRHFPFDKIKIDQSFITNITSDGTDAVLVRTMINVGHHLGLRVVAEGVETTAQCNYLRRNHCDELQGHHFSAAVAATEVPALFRRLQTVGATSNPADLGRSLLIVDDEDNVRRALLRLLRRDGYRILEANSAAAGLELLASESIQVILSDQRMPGMNGTEFLSRVKAIYPNTVRMVLSGFTELSSVTEAVNRGAIYKFLTKPWDDAELRTHVADAFARYEIINAGNTSEIASDRLPQGFDG